LSTRKLAAIAFVDIVGYTAMMEKDEAATLQLLAELRKILYPLAQQSNGSVLKELGDGLLLSFDSALDAIHCAVSLQRTVNNIPNLKLRIGIHLGDVVVERNDVFGEGVNVAARIQHFSPAGGIVITEDMWKQVKNHPHFSFVTLGARHVKGLHSAIKLLAVNADGLSLPSFQERVIANPTFKRTFIAVLIAATMVATYLLSPSFLGLKTEEVPSLAILYIKNLGTEAEEPYTYGITQDLIVDVAKAGLIRVAPMKDILSISKSDLSINDIAKHLRVRYVMEGSLKREEKFFHFAGQIVEAATGQTLWADHLQTTIADIASLKGQLAKVVLNTIQIKPSEGVKKEITKTRTANPEAYEFYLRAKYVFDKKKTKDDLFTARGMYERAISLDSTFVSPRIGLGRTYETEGDYERALQIYEQATTLAHQNGERADEAECLRRKGIVLWSLGKYKQALEVFTEVLNMFRELGAREGEAKTLNNIGIVYMDRGNYPQALDYYTQSLTIQKELDDRDGQGRTLNNIALTYEYHGNYPKALGYYQQSLTIARELGDRQSEALTLFNLGVLSSEQNDSKKALDYYLQSLTIRREIGDRSGEGETMGYLGKLYFDTKDYTSAQEYLHKAVALFEQVSIVQELVFNLSRLACVEAEIGSLQDAKQHAQTVEEKFPDELSPSQQIEIHWNLSRTYARLGEQEKANFYLNQAYQEIMERAKNISDQTSQTMYLQNVKLNREVITEWKRTHKNQ
jgi:tetratricopeptide (TPR) repeat protein/class 3 adenylate cyclase